MYAKILGLRFKMGSNKYLATILQIIPAIAIAIGFMIIWIAMTKDYEYIESEPQYDLYDQNQIKQLNCLPENNYDNNFAIKIQNNNETNIMVSMFELYNTHKLSLDILKPNEIKSFKNPDPKFLSYHRLNFELYDASGKLIGIFYPECKTK